MKKFIAIYAAVCVALVVIVAVFGSRNLSNAESTTGYTIDFEQLYNDTMDSIGDFSDTAYGFVSNVSLAGDDNPGEIYLYVETVEEAGTYATDRFAAFLIRKVNDAACIQYPDDFESSSQESLGTLYDHYAVYVNAVHDGSDEVYYVLSKEAGEETDLDPDVESYEDAWEEAVNQYIENGQDEAAAQEAGIIIVDSGDEEETSAEDTETETTEEEAEETTEEETAESTEEETQETTEEETQETTEEETQ